MPYEGGVEAESRAGYILTGSADIEQARGVAELNGEGAHQERRCFDQGVAEVFHGSLPASVGQIVLQNSDDRFCRLGRIDDQKNDVADQKACDYTNKRCQERLKSALGQE